MPRHRVQTKKQKSQIENDAKAQLSQIAKSGLDDDCRHRRTYSFKIILRPLWPQLPALNRLTFFLQLLLLPLKKEKSAKLLHWLQVNLFFPAKFLDKEDL